MKFAGYSETQDSCFLICDIEPGNFIPPEFDLKIKKYENAKEMPKESYSKMTLVEMELIQR